MTQFEPAESYDHDFIQRQFIEILRALEIQNEVQVPEDLLAPRENDVPGDLRELTDKVNRILSSMRLRASARTPLLTLGDGGIGGVLEALRDELGRVGNIQGGKGLLVRNTPDGIMLIPTDTQNEYLLPDDTAVLKWCKAKYDWESTEAPEVPYVDTNPCMNKDGEEVDETRTVRVYLSPQGHGDPNVRTGEVLGYRVDTNGDAICVTSYMDDRIGTVVMWTKGLYEPADIPGGWYICDGENGTVNLRERFVVGWKADSDDHGQLGALGGSATMTDSDHTVPAHSHTGTSGNESSHTHDVQSSGAHTNSGTTGAGSAHNHSVTIQAPGADEYTVDYGTTQQVNTEVHTHPASSGNESAHTHSFTSGSGGAHTHVTDAGPAHNHTISEQAAVTLTHSAQDNRPPWYTMFFIQRVS